RPPLDETQLAYEILAIGMQRAPAPVLLINEPMLVSQGENSHIRYNFFYPRWAYDDYREHLAEKAAENDWNYLDLWDILDADEFTNSAIHLTPQGTSLLALRILEAIQEDCGQ
ncbi:MAG: SGNH/GDSL hydrolase family protein, partial [Anaerolineales bacterium]